jgi:hypothetical protein
MLDPKWCPHLRLGVMTLDVDFPDTSDVDVFCYDCNTIARVNWETYDHRSTTQHLQWCYDIKRMGLTQKVI